MNNQFPLIPKCYAHIYKSFRNLQPGSVVLEECDCVACGRQNCPIEQDQQIKLLIEQLPMRLAHIHASNIGEETINDIKLKILQQLLSKLQINTPFITPPSDTIAPASQETFQEKNINSHDKNSQHTHVDRYLQKLFEQEYIEMNKEKQKPKKCKLTNIAVQLSFGSNIVLLILKIVALVISNSMALLASVMDSAMDILSGLVLFLANCMSKKGVQKGQYQKALHRDQEKIKIMFASRYESIGVLSFAAIMATLALTLIGESVDTIIGYAYKTAGEIDFGAIPMAILAFTIVLKLGLSIFCHAVCIKNRNDQYETITAYRDDHRNDVLTNSFGFLGAALTFYLKGNWNYCDPVVSLGLSVYICVNWVMNAKEQLDALLGGKSEDEVCDQLMMRLLHQSLHSNQILKIQSFISVLSGSQNSLEIILVLPHNLSVQQTHEIVQDIQNQFEHLDNVERCYVHAESDDCVNELQHD